MELRGARVLVTGASRGIGESLARGFAVAGARVALVARSADAIEALAGELGGTAHAADLGDAAAVAGLIDRIEAEGGPVDVLVNNAGVDNAGWFPASDATEVETLFRINLLTPVELCRQVLPGMLRRGRGHLVNVSSMAGTAVLPGLVAYSSSKAGLSHFTAGLRADLRGLPVKTTLVEVGPVPTDMLAGIDKYRPTEKAFDRSYRTLLTSDTPREVLAAAVVAAVARDRRHVRLPRRSAPMALLVEAPRRIAEVLLTGVPHRA